MLWSDYVYDEEASMQLAATMLESTEEARLGFVPASRNSVDNLEKMKLNLDVFDGHDGYSCRICLEDMDIGGEVIRMPCSHVFHLSCIDEWLGTNHVCPLCRFELPVSICHA
ncbi:hypothetical protein Sjap_019515 [Stephania japonica]|uniref:RING-type domain-containing protein n=1 Tax=Stephania japonica TaxID=461633 RepID=A0AAP0EYY4_9MAGN